MSTTSYLTDDTAVHRFRAVHASVRQSVTELCQTADCSSFVCESALAQQQEKSNNDNMRHSASAASASTAAVKFPFVQPIKDVPVTALSCSSTGGGGGGHASAMNRLLPIPAQIASVQRILNNLEYSFLPLVSFFDLRKRRSLRQILETGRDIVAASLPIRCLEAVFVGLLLTSSLKSVHRIPISMTSEAAVAPQQQQQQKSNNNSRAARRNSGHSRSSSSTATSPPMSPMHNDVNQRLQDQQQQQQQQAEVVQFKHIVLGIALTSSPSMYGSIGLSRRSCLMDKPLNFPSLAALLDDFRSGYQQVGHSLATIRLGLPVAHDVLSRAMPCWNMIEVIVPGRGAESAPAISDSLVLGRVLFSFEQLAGEMLEEYLRFVEDFHDAKGSTMRAAERRLRNLMRQQPEQRRGAMKESDLLTRTILESVGAQLERYKERPGAADKLRALFRGGADGFSGHGGGGGGGDSFEEQFVASAIAPLSVIPPAPVAAVKGEEEEAATAAAAEELQQQQQRLPTPPDGSTGPDSPMSPPSTTTTTTFRAIAPGLGEYFLADHLSIRENLFRIECLLRGVSPFRVATGQTLIKHCAFPYPSLTRAPVTLPRAAPPSVGRPAALSCSSVSEMVLVDHDPEDGAEERQQQQQQEQQEHFEGGDEEEEDDDGDAAATGSEVDFRVDAEDTHEMLEAAEGSAVPLSLRELVSRSSSAAGGGGQASDGEFELSDEH